MRAQDLLDCCAAGIAVDNTGRSTNDEVLYAIRYQALVGLVVSLAPDVQEGASLNTMYCIARCMEADLYHYHEDEVDSGVYENDYIVLSSDELAAATVVLAANGWDQDDSSEAVMTYIELIMAYAQSQGLSL